MKQNLPVAKPGAPLSFILLGLILCTSGCVTLPRDVSPAAQSALQPARTDPTEPLDINIASASELELLPGVGKVIAERIVAYRLENGPFRSVEHLMMVRGISDRKFRAMQSRITVKQDSQTGRP
ncbi:MAG TPA: helix-hairpin-helix domain-containing protein [Pyrinomonadaceae bacterium]|nr:helix-hairpin-helix domain-containing protein [Pyrinomonadaceae bacterium]